MIFRQLFDADTGTYTYLLADARSREAVLIDTVRERVDRDLALLDELGLELRYTLDTHVHADHVTGASLLRDRLGSRIVYPAGSEAEGADVLVSHGDTVRFGNEVLEVRETPGHTDACVTYVTGDGARAFTGDALLIRGSGRTDFQAGDARKLYRSVHDQILSLPDDTELYPGHDYKGRTVTTVREEKLHNPRLGGGLDEEAFVEIMAKLNLPHPKRIDVAVPANQRLGRLDDDGEAVPRAQPWAPVTRTATGAPQVTAEWLADHAEEVRRVDVRELDEWRGEMGHLEGAELAPLGTLAARLGEWDRDQPLVLICRSGGRSDHAALHLESRGFTRVASLAGGMIRWNALGLKVVHEGMYAA